MSKELLQLIEEFKTKDIGNIKYEYNLFDIDYAKSLYFTELGYGEVEYGEEFIPEKYLRKQEDIFPVKNNSELIFLVAMLYLFEPENLIIQLYNLVKDKRDSLILIKSAFVDNDKSLSWQLFNEKGIFLLAFYMSESYNIVSHIFDTKSHEDLYKNIKFYTDHMNKDVLVMAVAHFIYINVKEGRL